PRPSLAHGPLLRGLHIRRLDRLQAHHRPVARESRGRTSCANFEGSDASEPGANVDRENPSGAADHIGNCRVADCRTVHVESLKVRAHLLAAKRKVRQSDCKVPWVSILTVN